MDISTFISNHPAICLAMAAGMTIALPIAYRDYRAYVAMGPHGLPDNVIGWGIQTILKTLARNDVTVPAPYNAAKVAKSYGTHGMDTFFAEPLMPRAGGRPKVPSFVAPHRQVSDTASEERRKQMFAYLATIVDANTSILKSELSHLERHILAVQLKDGIPIPSFLARTWGEIAHVHPPDGSTHTVLSLADSAEIIEKGWGERHRLSGRVVPWSYTLIYAPRTDEEFEVWKGIVNAAAQFCCKQVGDIVLPA